MREVKLNGKLVFKGEVSKGDNSFKQEIELGNGQKMAVTASWEKDALALEANSVKLNIAGNNVNADFAVDWDISNPLLLSLKLKLRELVI